MIDPELTSDECELLRAYRNATDVAQDEAVANLLDRPGEGIRAIVADPTTERLRRWQRWCVFGWIVAGLLCLLVFASTYYLSRSAAQNDRTAAEAQAMAQEHLANLATTQAKLLVAEHRLAEMGIRLDTDVGESRSGEYVIHRSEAGLTTQPNDD